jgi:nicotinamidase-related amidase
MTDAAVPAKPWLVVIDMQEIFGDPASEWFTPGYPSIEPTVARLVEGFGERVVFTRFVAPQHPSGAWIAYYEQWPFALVPETDRLYDLMPAFGGSGHPVVSRTTFGKWDDELASLIPVDADVVLVGVSTDCCVLSTALPAADAGRHVLVVTDACAGLTELDHRRALDAMALYAPLIELTTADAVLTGVA